MRPRKIAKIKSEVIVKGELTVAYLIGPSSNHISMVSIVGRDVMSTLYHFASSLKVTYSEIGLPLPGNSRYIDALGERHAFRQHVANELGEFQKMLERLTYSEEANMLVDMLLANSCFKWESDIKSANNEFTITFTVID